MTRSFILAQILRGIRRNPLDFHLGGSAPGTARP